MSFLETLCCGSLVLQRSKDLVSCGSTFSVLVKLRIGAALRFSATK